MIVEFGHFILILSLCLAIVQIMVPFFAERYHDDSLMKISMRASVLQFLFILIAFLILVFSFIRSDFSLALVAAHSHEAKPLLYKISGTWGNHEGSMLLWILILSLYGIFLVLFEKSMPIVFKVRVLSIQAALSAGFLCFSIFTSNPFMRLSEVPFHGNGLNPVLQDPALAIHPPILYAGYVGFSLVFSIALSALWSRDKSYQWISCLRFWTLPAWIFLTLGIMVGSFWAYYELGWGGFWFWDPVENASLMPWLCGTALLHSALVCESRKTLYHWVILLSIVTFGLSISGTFLVRSGVLTSVHAFANDPERGVFILVLLAMIIGGALYIYARFSDQLETDDSLQKKFAFLSRDSALILNNVFLISATATIFIGTLYPLFIDVLGLEKISVGAPYFNTVLPILMAPLFFIMPIGTLLGWGSGRGVSVMKRLWIAACLSVITLCTILIVEGVGYWGAALGIATSIWIIVGALSEFITKFPKMKKVVLWRCGSVFSHAGVGVLLLGIVSSTFWRSEIIDTIKNGQSLVLANYEIILRDVSIIDGPNYRAEQVNFDILKAGKHVKVLSPSKRFYIAEDSQTTEAAIWNDWRGVVYMSLGDTSINDNNEIEYVIRIWYHPFILLIWFGAILMACGGVFSLWGCIRRRYYAT